MERKRPNEIYADEPCLVVAVYCAYEKEMFKSATGYPDLKPNGYATLASANKWIREKLAVKKKIDYKRGERPKLKDLHLDGEAVVCVLGHYIYLDGETYWSFFDNEEDDVVTVWMLKSA